MSAQLYCPHCGRPLDVEHQRSTVSLSGKSEEQYAQMAAKGWEIRRASNVAAKSFRIATCRNAECVLQHVTLSEQNWANYEALDTLYHATCTYDVRSGEALRELA